jgi:hypothetical protein
LEAVLGECTLVSIEHLIDLVQSQPNVIDGVDVRVVVEGPFRTCKVIAKARQCVALDQYPRKGSTGHPHDGVVPWVTEQLDANILHRDILAAMDARPWSRNRQCPALITSADELPCTTDAVRLATPVNAAASWPARRLSAERRARQGGESSSSHQQAIAPMRRAAQRRVRAQRECRHESV